MGSVVVSEVVHDTAHFPRSTMLASPHASSYQPIHHTTSSPTNPARAHASGGVDINFATTRPRGQTSTSATHPTQQPSPSGQHAPSSPKNDTTDEITTSPLRQSAPQNVTSSERSSAPRSSPSSLHSITAPPSPKRIKVKDLHHIQSFVEDEDSIPSLAATGQLSVDQTQESPQYEISEMPVTDVIEMVAGLLTKITSTNDDQAERLHGDVSTPEYGVRTNPLSSSVLAFHGKNVPTISIMSYLTRIQKYCPATYEVFLSLLVYFDRVTEKINAIPRPPIYTCSRDGESHTSSDVGSTNVTPQRASSSHNLTNTDLPRASAMTPESSNSDQATVPEPSSQPPSRSDSYDLAQCFVVDSFNIHRLIIAAVTCASKFFSDVFYTNSRYAKVGGLPLLELNQLEVQFLLLNDFRLSIAVEELEAYGTMLVEFYAREVIAQKQEGRSEGGANADTQ